MEAMACGLPVITPTFGGQSAFMNSGNAYIVDHTVVPVSETAAGLYPKFAGHNWAEPSLDHLRQLMRHVYSNQS
ncbi:MAG: glycosyl transferase family 2, partial [Verrucomicrobiota bacterium]|nr:glycosyl transferase family 2 [Verrucomicrobiota bacterium]